MALLHYPIPPPHTHTCLSSSSVIIVGRMDGKSRGLSYSQQAPPTHLPSGASSSHLLSISPAMPSLLGGTLSSGQESLLWLCFCPHIVVVPSGTQNWSLLSLGYKCHRFPTDGVAGQSCLLHTLDTAWVTELDRVGGGGGRHVGKAMQPCCCD